VFRVIGRRLRSLFRERDQGFSLIEVIVVLGVSALLFTVLVSLLLRTNVIKLANENLLAASTIAEDVLERIRKKSIDDFNALESLIGSNESLEIPFNSDTFATQFYPGESLPPALYRLPGAMDNSSLVFEVLLRNPSNGIEKMLVEVIIRWREAKGWSSLAGDGGGTVRNVEEREYILSTSIARSGLRVFLK